MKLRQPEPLRVLDYHDACVRHIDADFYDGRGYKNIYRSVTEIFHYGVLLFLLHPAMNEPDAKTREDLRLQVLGHLSGVQQVERGRHRGCWAQGRQVIAEVDVNFTVLAVGMLSDDVRSEAQDATT